MALHLGRTLSTFREHYASPGSTGLIFRSVEPVFEPLGVLLEGCLLFDVRPPGSPPSVDAEMWLFGAGQRIGLRSQRGSSYLSLSYDLRTRTWGPPVWLADAPEEWERVTHPQAHADSDVRKTYDFDA